MHDVDWSIILQDIFGFELYQPCQELVLQEFGVLVDLESLHSLEMVDLCIKYRSVENKNWSCCI